MPVHVTTTTSQTLSNKGFSGPVKFDGNVTIFGDLSCSGTQTFQNTIFSTTSAVSVVHVGSGPALWIGNDGTGDIASFYDIDSNVEVFHVGGNNGTFPNVGVKTSSPNVDFTVNGAISAASVIYDATSNSNQWGSVYSSFNAQSAANASVYSNVNSNSATNWNYQGTDIKSLTGNWQNTYTNFSSQSANNTSVFSTVQTNSASWGTGGGGGTIDTGVRALTGNWQSTYSTVQANSSTWGTGGGGTPAVSYSRWQLIGANSTTVYSISGATMTAPEAYRVTINSIIQDPAVYTIDASADTITFSSVPPLSSDIIVIESAITATSASGGGSITNSATPPVSPSSGDLWFNTENGILYVYYTDDDGSQWVAPDNGGGGSSGSMILLASATASNSAEILFDNVFNSSLYSEYELRYQGVQPAADNVIFRVQLRTSVPAGITTFHRNNYVVAGINLGGSGNNANFGGTTGWSLNNAAGNAANELNSGRMSIVPISGQWTHMYFAGYLSDNSAGDRYAISGAGSIEGTTTPAGVKIYFSSGNISRGEFQLYGIKK